jgi:hypothetical protein
LEDNIKGDYIVSEDGRWLYGSFPMAVFGIRGVETSSSSSTVLFRWLVS